MTLEDVLPGPERQSGCDYAVSMGHIGGRDRRLCGNNGYYVFGDLIFCKVHAEIVLTGVSRALRRDSGLRRWAAEAVAEAEAAELRRAREEEELQKGEQLRREEELAAKGTVYFVEREGFVKIGHTTDLKKRIGALNKGSCFIEGMTVGPVRLLARMPGGRDSESAMHKKFAHLRIGGEWFLFEDDLRWFIAGLKGCVAPELKASA